MKFIEYASKNPKLGCRVIATYFSIGKSSISNILKKTKALEKEYEFSKASCKKVTHGQYHLINENFINWYKKCTSVSSFPGGPMIKEQVMLIKERLNKDDLLHSLHIMAG